MDIKESISIIDNYIHGYCGESKKWVILDDKAETNDSWGKLPWKRELAELMEQGIINVDKPPGPTSHEVVAWIKRMLGITKAGHGGTLEAWA